METINNILFFVAATIMLANVVLHRKNGTTGQWILDAKRPNSDKPKQTMLQSMLIASGIAFVGALAVSVVLDKHPIWLYLPAWALIIIYGLLDLKKSLRHTKQKS